MINPTPASTSSDDQSEMEGLLRVFRPDATEENIQTCAARSDFGIGDLVTVSHGMTLAPVDQVMRVEWFGGERDCVAFCSWDWPGFKRVEAGYFIRDLKKIDEVKP